MRQPDSRRLVSMKRRGGVGGSFAIHVLISVEGALARSRSPQGDMISDPAFLGTAAEPPLARIGLGIRSWPVIEGPAMIILLRLYGALFSALVYEKIWTPIAEKLGLRVSTSDFQERLE